MTGGRKVLDTAENPGEAMTKAAACRRALAHTPERDKYLIKVEPHHLRPHVVSWWVLLVPRGTS